MRTFSAHHLQYPFPPSYSCLAPALGLQRHGDVSAISLGIVYFPSGCLSILTGMNSTNNYYYNNDCASPRSNDESDSSLKHSRLTNPFSKRILGRLFNPISCKNSKWRILGLFFACKNSTKTHGHDQVGMTSIFKVVSAMLSWIFGNAGEVDLQEVALHHVQ